MTDLRNYSKQFIEEFINMYKELPCLWRIKSKEYSNRNLRNEAYEKLTEKLKEIEPEANKDMVIKKINTLRTAFRREMKKVKECTHSGMGSDDVYEPRLWYYPLLSFTVDQETQREGKSNMEEDDSDKETQEEPTVENVDVTNQETEERNKARPVPTTKKRKSQHQQQLHRDTVLNMTYKTLVNDPEDECSVFGHHVANTLRNMNNKQQKLIAQKIINETLFYGELGQLTLQSAAQVTTMMQNLNMQQNFLHNTYAGSSPLASPSAPISVYNYESPTMSPGSSYNTSSGLWSNNM